MATAMCSSTSTTTFMDHRGAFAVTACPFRQGETSLSFVNDSNFTFLIRRPTSVVTDDEEESEEPSYISEHHNYMTMREQLQEFPGRVPQRTRKATDLGNPLQQQRQEQQKQKEKDKSKPKVREREGEKEHDKVVPCLSTRVNL
jgi:hypothetical protein